MVEDHALDKVQQEVPSLRLARGIKMQNTEVWTLDVTRPEGAGRVVQTGAGGVGGSAPIKSKKASAL